MSFEKRIVVTGGAGFIGSHVVRKLVLNYPNYQIINVDVLTYAGNLENLVDIDQKANYVFEKVDICDQEGISNVFAKYNVNGIIHLAAESHVDRSISDPLAFIQTNIVGTANLLNCAVAFWRNDFTDKRFYHVSTDEVYGSLGDEGFFLESTPYDPKSPYSASKASSDHLVRAFGHTYGLPIVISNCSNNYGPNQFPEKLIPLFISNIVAKKDLPVYGKGENVRDWLYVEDHAEAIDLIYHNGENQETYNIGGENEWSNINLIKLLCTEMDSVLNRESGENEELISYVKDRAGHDFRYAIDCSKIKHELGWSPKTRFEEGLIKTIKWYLSNSEWVENIKSGEYQAYYKAQYESR
ncbi:dTDP-glucose 4,6-dehydratase [Salibacteraceae bacterium]|jgi:dTDP-glucose 4,6-dehydratase|nr:dTDP-glucose 4,6-dehydratase [Salibacteraceae bacterium]MDB4105517.1 dTDP-glucose 4,6-dehydratase [Salibacteraceae bacterium]MDB9709516.1 dTDP-glucose 4,6-dehydratase [Salibacteraceae bacterium]HAQ71077.1 dTDP-glucose 4,6-dehydratase [Flavobacteriales bacterium]